MTSKSPVFKRCLTYLLDCDADWIRSRFCVLRQISLWDCTLNLSHLIVHIVSYPWKLQKKNKKKHIFLMYVCIPSFEVK